MRKAILILKLRNFTLILPRSRASISPCGRAGTDSTGFTPVVICHINAKLFNDS